MPTEDNVKSAFGNKPKKSSETGNVVKQLIGQDDGNYVRMNIMVRKSDVHFFNTVKDDFKKKNKKQSRKKTSASEIIRFAIDNVKNDKKIVDKLLNY